jgi:hypothetical protein
MEDESAAINTLYLHDFVAVIGSIALLAVRSEGASVALHRGLPIC